MVIRIAIYVSLGASLCSSIVFVVDVFPVLLVDFHGGGCPLQLRHLDPEADMQIADGRRSESCLVCVVLAC